MNEEELINKIQQVSFNEDGLTELKEMLEMLQRQKRIREVKYHKLLDWKYDTKVDLLIHLSRLKGER